MTVIVCSACQATRDMSESKLPYLTLAFCVGCGCVALVYNGLGMPPFVFLASIIAVLFGGSVILALMFYCRQITERLRHHEDGLTERHHEDGLTERHHEDGLSERHHKDGLIKRNQADQNGLTDRLLQADSDGFQSENALAVDDDNARNREVHKEENTSKHTHALSRIV